MKCNLFLLSHPATCHSPSRPSDAKHPPLPFCSVPSFKTPVFLSWSCFLSRDGSTFTWFLDLHVVENTVPAPLTSPKLKLLCKLLAAPESRAEGRWQVGECEGKKIPLEPKEVTEGDAGKAALHNVSIWPIMDLLSRNIQTSPKNIPILCRKRLIFYGVWKRDGILI